jgi:hypothetical protein
VKKLAKKSRKNRKRSSYLATWDNTFSLVDDSSYYSKIQYLDSCQPYDVNKIDLHSLDVENKRVNIDSAKKRAVTQGIP